MFEQYQIKSKVDLLVRRYMKLQEEAFKLTWVSREQSDEKYTEALQVLRALEKINPISTNQDTYSQMHVAS